MTIPDDVVAGEEIRIGDFLAPLMKYRSLIWNATVAVTGFTILAGSIYYLWQPTQWSTSLEFRPVFKGAQQGEYPNGLNFSPTDALDPTLVSQVYDKNQVQSYCTPEEFRSGFTTQETSAELRFLDLEFQARLADAKLSLVDRDRLQANYRARRQAIPRQYMLMWLRSDGCSKVPAAVATKSLTDLLMTWASDADSRRGVMKFRVSVLTPAVFDTAGAEEQTLLIRAYLVRAAAVRVIENITEVELLPGAELIHVGGDRVSFAQVRARLEDLLQMQLVSYIVLAGQGLGDEGIRWVRGALEQEVIKRRVLDEQAAAYQEALREYSGGSAIPPSVAQRSQGGTAAPPLTPQVDLTFIDRMVELTETNTSFRQELIRKMVDAKVAAAQTNIDRYTQLLADLKAGSNSSATMADIEGRLLAIINEAKTQVKLFNELYNEFSAVSLRPASSMYRIEQPAQVEVLKAFTLRSLVLLALLVVIGTPLALAVGCLAHNAVRQLAKRPLRA